MVGLQTVLRDVRLVSGSLPTRSETQRTNPIPDLREAFPLRAESAFCQATVSGRFPCRTPPAQPVKLTNSGG
ncbi:hypothetical protein [Spirosoma pomorum]